jgi:LuxR family maltose regulon positive regulatory protein
MAAPMVLTKLHRPRLRPNLVARTRLIDRLNEGLRQNRKLTLLTAPAGFGKTTLVADWLQQLDRPFAWICLDEGDNDPVRFLPLVVAALQTVDESIGRSLQSVLLSRPLASNAARAQDDDTPGTLSLVTVLINDLIKASKPLVLVLDDYHLITQAQVHQAVQFLLGHQPSGLHLVVLTREDPPFALPRMRVRTELTEVRERDLRFTETEAAAFLTGTMGLDLSAEAIATLGARTEGWIAGLQMVALSLEGQDAAGVADRIATFSGTHHYVIDYLAEEVLRRQPQVVQDFMCQTAILDRLCAPLCDAVTERGDSQSILVALERSNLFLIALDDQLGWFRYHHLFRGFLCTRLEPRQQTALHHKAALWYEAHSLMDKAVEHALAAGDLDEAERVIGLAAGRAIQDGQLAIILDWLNSLPAGRIRANGELATHKGWALCLMGHREAAESFATWAEASLAGDTHSAHRGELLALQAYLAVQRGDNANALRLAQQALATTDTANPLQRTFQCAALLSLGHAQRGLGDTQAAIDAFQRVASSAQAYGDELATMGALEELAWLLHRHGRRAEAADLCHQAIDRCLGAGSGPLPMLAIAYIVLAMMWYEANDLAQAQQQAQQGLELCQQLMMPSITLRGKILLARLLQAAGKYQMATATMEEARQTAARLGIPRYARLLDAAAADLHLLQGHIAQAARWAETARLSVAEAALTADETEYLVYARLLIAQGRLDEANQVLASVTRSTQERERYGSLITIHILQARVEQALGRKSEALGELERALSLAAPRGYYRAFLDAGSSIAELLPLLRPVAPEMVDRLLASLAAESRHGVERAASLLDPLSGRELEVLRLVAGGLSNREAAQALFVTEETIKKHLSHIYDKLAVKSRTQAIARAKESGWLA